VKPSALTQLASGKLGVRPVEEIDKEVRSGEYQYHNFGTCHVFTRIANYDYEKVLEVVLLLGDGFLEIKEEVVAHLVSFGKKHGCKAVEAWSRLGLEPTLRPLGWKKKKVLLRKEIL